MTGTTDGQHKKVFKQQAKWISEEKAIKELTGNEAKLLIELQGTAHTNHVCDRTQEQLSESTGIAFSSVGPTTRLLEKKGFVLIEAKASTWGTRTFRPANKGTRRGGGSVQYYLEQTADRYYVWRQTRPERQFKRGIYSQGNKVQGIGNERLSEEFTDGP